MSGRARKCALTATVLTATAWTAATAYAAWSASTSAAQSVTSVSVVAPASLAATASGQDIALSWPSGPNGTGYVVKAAANGASSSCTSIPAATISTPASTTYTDAGRYTPQGTWYCYQVATRAGSWTSQASNPLMAVQIGFVATTVTLANGGIAGRLDLGDTITVAFNQPVTTASGPATGNSVCTIASTAGQINVASTTTTGACATTETTNIGVLTGVNSNRAARYSATYAWSNANKTLKITLGARTVGTQDPTVTGTFTFTPTTITTRLQSATGAFHICDTNAGGGNCTPTATGTL